jgi:hypothetical protein
MNVKSRKGMKHHFKIPIRRGGKYFIDVYIWETTEAMYENAKPCTTNYKKPPDRDFVGCYIAFPRRLKKGGKFGEVHMLSQHVGSALVAHEFMHAILDWISETFECITSRSTERICYTMSDMNYIFWKKYYQYGTVPQPVIE